MRFLAEAPLCADEAKASYGAEQISGADVHVRPAVPSSAEAPPTKASGTRWPIVALRPTGDGASLARTLARVLVRRALIQEQAIDVVGDCANPTPSR